MRLPGHEPRGPGHRSLAERILAPGLESTLAGYGHAIQFCTAHSPQPHLIYGAFLLIDLCHYSTEAGKVKKEMSQKEYGRERVKWGATSSMDRVSFAKMGSV